MEIQKDIKDKIGVYRIVNTINGKIYIGSSVVCLYKRAHTHRNYLRADKHCNRYLQNSWNKYGEHNFVFDIIGEITKLLNPIMGTISGIATGALIGGGPGAIIGGVLGAASDVSRGFSGGTDTSTSIRSINSISASSPSSNAYMSEALGLSDEQMKRQLQSQQTTNMLLGKLVNQTGTIKIDSTKIGTGLSLNSRQIQ